MLLAYEAHEASSRQGVSRCHVAVLVLCRYRWSSISDPRVKIS